MSTESDSAPLVIYTAEFSAFGEARIVVELTGEWLDTPPVPSGESALLIVDGNGLVHRFAEISAAVEEARAGDEYLGSFVIPAQFRRRIGSPTALRAGGVTVTVPPAIAAADAAAATADHLGRPPVSPPRTNDAARESDGARSRRGASPIPEAPASAVAAPAPAVSRVAPPPAPPVTDPVAAALREELSQRVSEETRMRRELSQLRSQLETRNHNYERLESAQGELRQAVADLGERLRRDAGQRAALEASNAGLETANAELATEVGSLRSSLDHAEGELLRIAAERDAALAELSERYAELAKLKVSRETALEEVEELRRELERGGAELGGVREQFGTVEVEEAERLLAETRALTARLLDQGGEQYAAAYDPGD